MGKYLKSYKKYPAGSLIVSKRYSFWKRFVWTFKKGSRPYNHIFILDKDSNICISKWEKFKNDYHVFLLKKPYSHKELTKLKALLKSCKTNADYLVAINIIRPNTVDENLDNIRYNDNYNKLYLEEEPFQDIPNSSFSRL